MAKNMNRLSQRALFKTTPGPLRLSNSTLSRCIHSVKTPYTGPPSYNMIARRFSPNNVNPCAYFTRLDQQMAKSRGEFVGVHDVGDITPTDYDVLIRDIKDETLHSLISRECGIDYHSKVPEAEANNVVQSGDGYLRGSGNRPIVLFAVSHKGDARWVYFLLDTGAPITYLSIQTANLFGMNEANPSSVTIGGHIHSVSVSPENSQFRDINLLGGDFLKTHNVYLTVDYPQNRVKLYFGGEWAIVPKSTLGKSTL